MAQQPFLKSIKPVNLLSFGPNTEEIELRPLNILIGANGSGKSNLIEILGLLNRLPDKDPWSTVIQTGGAPEWMWKGPAAKEQLPSITVMATGSSYPSQRLLGDSRPNGNLETLGALLDPANSEEKPIRYSISLRAQNGGFEVAEEQFKELDRYENDEVQTPSFRRQGWTGQIYGTSKELDPSERLPSVPPDRSVLSFSGGAASILRHVPKLPVFAEDIERFTFYRDWVFGSGSKVRDIQPVGFDSYRLAGDSINLAQVLKAMRDRGDSAVFERLLELMRKFYEPVKDVDTELVGTHLRIMLKEEGLSSRTPAERLSDGTLRWLMLLIVLLDPTPPPVICIDEPELGLHPDIFPTLADLLIEASTRTQLIVTTHSRSFLDSFTDTPDAVCVCEKVEGATVIERLDGERLQAWLDKYSLGKLWTIGEIGGNRW